MKTQHKISVYLVDDDALYVHTLALSLNERFKSEIQIKTFTTGEDCLRQIQQNPQIAADMVILDYHLNTESKSAMNGMDMLKKIKEINSGIIVVMLSAEDSLKIANDSIKSGAYEYIVKSETAFIRAQNVLLNGIEKEFNSKILKITMTILEKHPELYKFIEEIPFRVSDTEGTDGNLKSLKDYYEYLYAYLKNYTNQIAVQHAQ